MIDDSRRPLMGVVIPLSLAVSGKEGRLRPCSEVGSTASEIKDPVQDAITHLEWWMPIDAAAERCSVFDVAYMLVTTEDSALDPKMASRYSMVREALVAEALHGSRLADDALRYAATVLLNSDKDLPPWLGRYFVFGAAEDKAPSKRGPKPQTNSLRDTAIAWTAGEIAITYNLNPTRGPATKDKETKESGCSIVQKALVELGLGKGMKEENVNAIWRRAGPRDDTRSALMEATMAANTLRRDFWLLFASRPRSMGGDAEWLKGHDPREIARTWRRVATAHRSPRARSPRNRARRQRSKI